MEVMPQGGIPSLNQGRQVKGDREFGSDQREGVLSGGCLSKEGHPNEEQAQAENIRLLGRTLKQQSSITSMVFSSLEDHDPVKN